MKTKKILVSIFLIILIFFQFNNQVEANIFDDDKKKDSEIIETIEDDEGGLFEKIIAKMIRWYSRNGF